MTTGKIYAVLDYFSLNLAKVSYSCKTKSPHCILCSYVDQNTDAHKSYCKLVLCCSPFPCSKSHVVQGEYKVEKGGKGVGVKKQGGPGNSMHRWWKSLSHICIKY